ncbi:MAG: caffeoyl O-methyltransferase match [Pedosphaera sp.]|nr:caffeoyl O-methyltransferase match [Pedosphaera sp.]
MPRKSPKPYKPQFNHKSNDGLKYVPLNERLCRYVNECRSHKGDHVLEALRKETEKKFPDVVQMQIGRDQGTFMTALVGSLGTRRAIEIGTFTGYSSICIARGLTNHGRLICLDVSEEWTNVARKYWSLAGVDGKIDLYLGPAADAFKQLHSSLMFEFAFIDADKPGYDTYYELVLPHMRKNGVILFDNMLWGGKLGQKKSPKHPNGSAIDKLNRKLARDPRVESVLLSIGDGVNMCRVLG